MNVGNDQRNKRPCLFDTASKRVRIVETAGILTKYEKLLNINLMK